MIRKCSLSLSLRLGTIVPILLPGVAPGRADDQEQRGAVKLLAPIPHVRASRWLNEWCGKGGSGRYRDSG
jgi:hypothetical protein